MRFLRHYFKFDSNVEFEEIMRAIKGTEGMEWIIGIVLNISQVLLRGSIRMENNKWPL